MSDELHNGGIVPANSIDLKGVSIDEMYDNSQITVSEAKGFEVGELSDFNDLFAVSLSSNKKEGVAMKHIATLPFATFPDVKGIFTDSSTDPISTERQTFDLYSRIDKVGYYSDYTILVTVRIEGELECNFDIALGKDSDKIYTLPDKYKSAASYIIQALRNYVYGEMNRFIKEAGPAHISNFFFGNVLVSDPDKGVLNLRSYIINLNDSTGMTREEIADKIDSLMGDDVPRIPVNPMSWLLEDRPVEFVGRQWNYSDFSHAKVITSDKITAGKVYIKEIPPPAKEPTDGKAWFEVGYVLPSDIDLVGPVHLSIDTPPEF